MFETLYASGNGIGLAAPQVGIKKNCCNRYKKR